MDTGVTALVRLGLNGGLGMELDAAVAAGDAWHGALGVSGLSAGTICGWPVAPGTAAPRLRLRLHAHKKQKHANGM